MEHSRSQPRIPRVVEYLYKMAKACKVKTLTEQQISSILTETTNLRKSLQTCRVHENEEKREGLLLFCKKLKSNVKAQGIYIYIYIIINNNIIRIIKNNV